MAWGPVPGGQWHLADRAVPLLLVLAPIVMILGRAAVSIPRRHRE